ncbi:transposase family protein [Streptomyces endophyticus]|uniref:Transposase n=1 Tax=Streptomyces endophyticus TaxID=714166 RepID=A0ABU6FM40_9ACTN|nr:transposase family protein [Streptomyces endophyticus]MEB8343921.1 transposase [Streptomyces endophyticus]
MIVNGPRLTGLTGNVIAELVAEIGPLWADQQYRRLSGRPRRRAVGAGARHKLVFVDRLLATLVHLRHGVTHDVLACWFGVHRSTITRAIGEIRPLLAQCGCAVGSGIRLRTLADVVDYLSVSGQSAIIDATEIRVRRPAAGTDSRDRYVSGKSKQNAVKVLVVTDTQGQLLFGGALQPGSCPDITQARNAGLVELLDQHRDLHILADAGYQALGAQTGGQVITPPHRKFKKNAPTWWEERFTQQRKAHSSRRIRVEHGIAHLKNWRALSRHLGRRELLDELVPAIAGLASIHRRPPQPAATG